jgi:hypothetical protein
VSKLLSVYRYHFPETTIINANPTLRIYWSGVSILGSILQNFFSAGKLFPKLFTLKCHIIFTTPLQEMSIMDYNLGFLGVFKPFKALITNQCKFDQIRFYPYIHFDQNGLHKIDSRRQAWSAWSIC